MYKFHHMERVEYPKITFTTETEIPELPQKKDRLAEPSKKDFDLEMTQQDRLIQEVRARKDELIKKRISIREGGRRVGENRTRKGELQDRINQAKVIRGKKRVAQDAMRDI